MKEQREEREREKKKPGTKKKKKEKHTETQCGSKLNLNGERVCEWENQDDRSESLLMWCVYVCMYLFTFYYDTKVINKGQEIRKENE